MATRTIAGKTVQVNDEGFMTNPAEWTKEIAAEIAKEEGIAELDARPLEGDRFLPPERRQTRAKRPPCASITTGTGVSTKEMFALFPKGPAKKVARISGLGKPEGCV